MCSQRFVTLVAWPAVTWVACKTAEAVVGVASCTTYAVGRSLVLSPCALGLTCYRV